jgi:hypothetical protein
MGFFEYVNKTLRSILLVRGKKFSNILAVSLSKWLINYKMLAKFQTGFVKGNRHTEIIDDFIKYISEEITCESIKSHRTNLHKNSVINMGSKIYNKLLDHMKEIDSYKVFKEKLKSFLLLHTFCSVEEFLSL